MSGYRIYILDRCGHIQRALEVEAVDDAEALSTAQAVEQTNGLEIWQLARCVAVMDARATTT